MTKRGYILFRHVETETSEIKTIEVHTEVLEIDGQNYLGITCPVCGHTIAILLENLQSLLSGNRDAAKKYIARRGVSK